MFVDKLCGYSKLFLHLKEYQSKKSYDYEYLFACILKNATGLGTHKIFESSHLNYDKMVQKTDLIVQKLSKFIDTNKDVSTNRIINREKGNRKIRLNLRYQERNKILNSVSLKYKNLFIKLEKIYES